MTKKKKERVELQFNLSNQAEKELIEFIDQNGSTRAGFIKSVIRQYMNTMQSMRLTGHAEQQSPTETKPKKKRLSNLGQSYSSKDM